MKVIRTKVYKFIELNEEAKQYCISQRRNTDNSTPAWTDENFNSLKAFAEIFPVKIKKSCYGSRSEGVDYNFTESDSIENLSGQRLATYIWNNYKRLLYKGKYFSLWSKTEKSYKHYKDGYPVLKQRHSKVQLENSCVMTGYCMDDNILNPVYNFLKKPSANINFTDLLDDCFSEWVEACNADVEYQDSDEYIENEIISNDADYTKNGKQFFA